MWSTRLHVEWVIRRNVVRKYNRALIENIISTISGLELRLVSSSIRIFNQAVVVFVKCNIHNTCNCNE